jgi:hypothetical protein
MIALYVGDIPEARNDATWLTSFKAQLSARFKIKDMGDLFQILGMHITRDRSTRTISLDKSKYLCDILAKYGMTDSKPSSFPVDPGLLAGLAHMTSSPLTDVAKDVYPSLMGSLHYAAVCTRPDVSTALSILGSAQASPTDAHMQPLKKVLRYPHGTIDMRLTLGRGTYHILQLTSFVDADWANDSITRKSRLGYLFTLGLGPISYKSKQQTCVAQSTCEVKSYTPAGATKEGLHLRQLMGEIFNPPITETTPSWDSQSAIAYSHNALVIEKTKHVFPKWQFFKYHVEQGTIMLRYLPTDQVVADMCTKHLPEHAVTRHKSAILGGEDPMQRFIP